MGNLFSLGIGNLFSPLSAVPDILYGSATYTVLGIETDIQIKSLMHYINISLNLDFFLDPLIQLKLLKIL